MADDKYSRNRQKVYDLLKGEGYTDDELGGSADVLFQDRGNAKMAYEYLSGAGYNNLAKDQNDFNSLLFEPDGNEQRRNAAEGRAMFDQMRESRKPATSPMPAALDDIAEDAGAMSVLEERKANESRQKAEEAYNRRAEAAEGYAEFNRMRNRDTSPMSAAPEGVLQEMEEKPEVTVQTVDELNKLREGVKDDEAFVDEDEALKA
jgi:hypothetical protein